MRISDIARSLSEEGLGCALIGDGAANAASVCFDSRDVKKGNGALFAALPGERVDGLAFIASAVKNGAVAVMASSQTEGIGVPQLIVSDARAAFSKAAHLVYGEPSKRLVVIGVTGTNGKTTTTYLIEAILEAAGFKPGVIGTVNYRYNGRFFDAPHTTPEASEAHRIMRDMADDRVTHCVMEVSSHALSQKRVEDCVFRAGVFTNLTHEHLDYHHTMEEYFEAKAILFKRLLKNSGGVSVINVDDAWGGRLAGELNKALTFSLRSDKAASIVLRPGSFTLGDSGIQAACDTPAGAIVIRSRLVGEYNLQNILGAIGASIAVGVGPAAIEAGIASLKRVPGRLEKSVLAERMGIAAYVDYAHTGDALERALSALRKVAGGRVITVFGCGGNRDKGKRPVMGAVSAALSDITIITSDNPRDEDPLEIIKEVESGVVKAGLRRCGKEDAPETKAYIIMPDRREAIRKAASIVRQGDTILVAGKGHEGYQIAGGVISHFNDLEELDAAIAAKTVSKKAAYET